MVSRTQSPPAGPLTENELAAWRGLLRAHAALIRDLDSDLAQSHDLSLSAYEVLLALAEAPEGRLRMSDLAESVLLSRSGLTRLADRLEREGLIERRPCASDARGSHAVLTSEGRRRFTAARRTHLTGVRERYLSHFDEDEMALLGSFWERLAPGAVSDDGSSC